MRGQMSSAHVHVETSHCHIAMTFCHNTMTSSKQFGINGVQRCAILSHDIGSLSHDIGSLSHDNKPFPHGFDSFPYRFNGATIGFRPSTIAFVLDPSDSKSLRYNSALDSCALAADSSLFTPGRHRSGAGKTASASCGHRNRERRAHNRCAERERRPWGRRSVAANAQSAPAAAIAAVSARFAVTLARWTRYSPDA